MNLENLKIKRIYNDVFDPGYIIVEFIGSSPKDVLDFLIIIRKNNKVNS